jgi:hypothetical protein
MAVVTMLTLPYLRRYGYPLRVRQKSALEALRVDLFQNP